MRQGALRRRTIRFAVLSLTLAAASMIPVVVAGTPAAAGNGGVVIVSGDRQEESLDAALRVIESPLDTLDAESVFDAPDALPWRTIDERRLRPGISGSRWWLRVDLYNPDSQPQARVIAIRQPTLDDVRFAMLCNDGYSDAAAGGDARPYSARRLPDRNPAFDFMVPANGRCMALLTVKSLETVQFPAVIADPASYYTLQQRDNLIRGLGFGMQILLFLAAIVLAIAMRSRPFAQLALLTGVQASLVFVLSGMGYQFLWGELPALQRALAAISISLTWTVMALYYLQQLPADITRGSVSLLTRASCVVALGAGALHVAIPDPRIVGVLIGACTFGLVLMLSVTLGARMLGVSWSRLSALGILVLTVGALIEASGYLGIISLGSLFLLPVQTAFLIQTVLFGIALLSPSVHLLDEGDAPPLDQEVNRRVAERTRELASTVAQLQSTNRQLDRISSTDPLTGTWNRRHMDNYLANVAGTVPEPLAFILFDIDLFKEVNDRYGHPVGDRCLCVIAECVQKQLRDHNDILCRYGGEEFAVILPNTDLEGAKAVAEKIRLAVEQATIRCTPGIELHVTVSLGISALDTDADLEHLVGSADQALYRAKRDGRNRWLAATA